ncbi:MAG: M48 family metallopeptidase [Arenicella sp.]
MKFENPDIKEGINVSQEHPLKEFWQLSVGVLVLVGLAILVLHYSASYLVRYIPFSFEKTMTDNIEFLVVEPSATQEKLQQLADELSLVMELPDDMHITVHYSEEETVNAFATLGGHVFFYKGLLDKLESEDALAMVMAHEIAHVKHRHPMTAMGKGLTLMTAGAAIAGASGSSAGNLLIGQSMNLSLLKFSRDQETQSDLSAAQAIQKRYRHIQGAEKLFSVFADLQSNSLNTPELFSSHPQSDDRWLTLKKFAQDSGWAVTGKVTPLQLPQ